MRGKRVVRCKKDGEVTCVKVRRGPAAIVGTRGARSSSSLFGGNDAGDVEPRLDWELLLLPRRFEVMSTLPVFSIIYMETYIFKRRNWI